MMVWNFIQFQAGWFALVISAANGLPLLGVGAMLLLVLVHLRLAARPFQEALFLVLLTVLGWLWESLLWRLDLLDYTGTTGLEAMAPYWMAALWLNFATTVNFSLGWLQARPVLAACLGAVGGPLAFLAGEKLGAVNFPDTFRAMAAIGLGWLVLTPAMMLAARTWADNRFQRWISLSAVKPALAQFAKDD